MKIGHTNDSFIVNSTVPGGESYFLQKINHSIFKNVEGLQQNIRLVILHLRQKYIQSDITETTRRVLRLIPTKSGQWFYKDEEGSYWRMYVNITGTILYLLCLRI